MAQAQQNGNCMETELLVGGQVLRKGNMDQQYSNQSSTNTFDAMLVAEIQILRSGEQRLARLYSDLQTKPQLRGDFLRELAELQLRADRLDAVLSPVRSTTSQAYLA